MAEATYYQTESSESSLEGLPEKLDQIGLILASSRSEAIAGRQDSGIEEEWLEDEEYYEGIDDANRSELKAWRGKPLGQQTTLDQNKDERGSTIFLNITGPYCDAVSSRIGDMLLPTDDRSWHIKPTPRPEFINIAQGKLSFSIKDAIKKDLPNDPDAQYQKMKEIMDQATEDLSRAKEAAQLAENQIWDWHVECQYHAHNRRVIDDAVKVGSGVIKGPVPEKTTKIVYKEGKIKLVEDIKPVSRRISYRNFYPDPACGEDLHDGNFTWERDDITRKKLSDLRGVEGYVDDQILQCIKEGPQEATKEFADSQDAPGLKASTDARKHMFEIWYYHGTIRREELIAIEMMAGVECEDYKDEYVFVQVTMVNNRVIKAEISHLSSGKFPYDMLAYRRRTGMPWGIGIARMIRAAQRIVVGAIRHMMDNAGIAGGPMLFMNDMLVAPAEGPAEVRPWKVYVAGPDYEPGMDMKEAIQYLVAPMMQEELEAIVNLGMRFAEDLTGLPSIMQGQTNQRTPDTLGGMIMQNNNASSVLRRIARNYDDMITEPHIGRYYDHILEYVEDDTMKGDFTIDALGSSALIERDMQNQAILAAGPYTERPQYGLDPKKWMAEYLKSNKVDIKRLEYDDEQWQKVVEGLQQPPPDPKLEIAQMNAQSKIELEQMKLADKDKDRAMKMGLAEMEKEFDIYAKEMGDESQMTREQRQAKSRLAETMLKLRTQLYMQGQDGKGGQLTPPPVEPTGKAPAGEAFAR